MRPRDETPIVSRQNVSRVGNSFALIRSTKPRSALVPRNRILRMSGVSTICCVAMISAEWASLRMVPEALSEVSRVGLITRKPAPVPGMRLVETSKQKGAEICGQDLVGRNYTPLSPQDTESTYKNNRRK